jgi:predicted amidohydrolase YtcJ
MSPAVLLCSTLASLAQVSSMPADVLITGATIRTSDPQRPLASAMAVRDGKIVAIGEEKDVLHWEGTGTKRLRFAGKTITPGFIDGHCHPRPIYPEDAPWQAVECGPDKIKSMEELIAALRRKADKTPRGNWVTGSNYQETLLGRHPSKVDLDQASNEHPILIRHSSGHRAVCNSKALELAGVTRQTEDPPGGAFDRDERGEPNGILKEGASSIVRRAGPRDQESPTRSQQVAGYRECFRRFLAAGLTAVHVAGTTESAVALMAEAQQEMPVRLYIMHSAAAAEDALRRVQEKRLGDDWIRYGAVKLFHGNSLSGQTAWLSEPYVDRPGDHGVPPARSQESLNALISRLHQGGVQVCVHCNGDREIDMLLTAYERALAEAPRVDHRHRIEHCSVVTPELLARMQKLKIAVAPHSYIFEHGDKMDAYGPVRWDWMHATKSLLDLGAIVAGTSDYPVSAALPLLRIQDLVERKSRAGKVYGAKQRIPVEQALAVWTLGSARAGFMEHRIGSLEVGKIADFVVLAEDPIDVESGMIHQIVVEQAYVGGKLRWEHGQAPAPLSLD